MGSTGKCAEISAANQRPNWLRDRKSDTVSNLQELGNSAQRPEVHGSGTFVRTTLSAIQLAALLEGSSVSLIEANHRRAASGPSTSRSGLALTNARCPPVYGLVQNLAAVINFEHLDDFGTRWLRLPSLAHLLRRLREHLNASKTYCRLQRGGSPPEVRCWNDGSQLSRQGDCLLARGHR